MLNIDSGYVETFESIHEVISMINSDRADGWNDYDEEDWQKGLIDFTNYRQI